MAQQSFPPPVIPLGTSPKEVEISTTYWYAGSLNSSAAVFIGEVTAVESEVHQTVSQISPEESCTIRLEAMYGKSPELVGATSVKLHASYVQDLYQQLEPDWGVYRHLKVGQRVVALLHRYEGELAIGSEALIALNENIKALPDILRRTGFGTSRFTSSDLAVLKRASPLFHDEVAGMAEFRNGMRPDAAADLNRLVGACLALCFGGVLCADHFRRQLSAQKPTT